MAKMNYKQVLCLMSAWLLLSCECPYLEKEDYGYQQNTRRSVNGDVFYAEKLLGTWQCYYPMIRRHGV